MYLRRHPWKDSCGPTFSYWGTGYCGFRPDKIRRISVIAVRRSFWLASTENHATCGVTITFSNCKSSCSTFGSVSSTSNPAPLSRFVRSPRINAWVSTESTPADVDQNRLSCHQINLSVGDEMMILGRIGKMKRNNFAFRKNLFGRAWPGAL